MTYHSRIPGARVFVANTALTRRFRLSDLTPMQRAILLALRGSSRSKPVTADMLADAIYSDRPDGGPEMGAMSIRQTVYFLRRRLRGTPVAVCARRGPDGGYWLGGAAAALP